MNAFQQKNRISKADIEAAILTAGQGTPGESDEATRNLMRAALPAFHINPELVPPGVAMMYQLGLPGLADTLDKNGGYPRPLASLAATLIEESLRKLPGVDAVFVEMEGLAAKELYGEQPSLDG